VVEAELRALLLHLLLVAVAAGPTLGQGVSVELSPSTVQVAPGGEFDIGFRVAAAGDSFNGYDLVLGYDPARLTLLGQPASQQEGALFTDACPNRFHLFSVAGDSTQATVAHVLLCAGQRVAGPGELYRIRFRAFDGNAVTHLRVLEGTTFYDGGPEVEPLQSQDATVLIGDATHAGPRRPPGWLRAHPNPFNPRTTVSFSLADGGPVRLDVMSLRGRHVVRLVDRRHPAGIHRATWDGRDDTGQPVASGVYLLRLHSGSGTLATPVALVR